MAKRGEGRGGEGTDWLPGIKRRYRRGRRPFGVLLSQKRHLVRPKVILLYFFPLDGGVKMRGNSGPVAKPISFDFPCIRREAQRKITEREEKYLLELLLGEKNDGRNLQSPGKIPDTVTDFQPFRI